MNLHCKKHPVHDADITAQNTCNLRIFNSFYSLFSLMTMEGWQEIVEKEADSDEIKNLSEKVDKIYLMLEKQSQK